MRRHTVEEYEGIAIHATLRAILPPREPAGVVSVRYPPDARVAVLEGPLDIGPDRAGGVLMFRHGGGDQRLEVRGTRPRFGGWRWWVASPRCGRTVATFYRRPDDRTGPFWCRTCHGLSYASRQASDSGRFRRILRRLVRDGLGGPPCPSAGP